MILDVCCGSGMFYFDKDRKDVVTVDIRKEQREIHGKKINVDPDIIGDFRDIPFENDKFDHVIFDPPHFIEPGKNSVMYAQYGGLCKDSWEDDILQGFKECWRVLRPGGTLVFKWSEHDVKVRQILDMCPYKPLYGHKRGKTIWMIFVKENDIEGNQEGR